MWMHYCLTYCYIVLMIHIVCGSGKVYSIVNIVLQYTLFVLHIGL